MHNNKLRLNSFLFHSYTFRIGLDAHVRKNILKQINNSSNKTKEIAAVKKGLGMWH